jgi:hypothetical protein
MVDAIYWALDKSRVLSMHLDSPPIWQQIQAAGKRLILEGYFWYVRRALRWLGTVSEIIKWWAMPNTYPATRDSNLKIGAWGCY